MTAGKATRSRNAYPGLLDELTARIGGRQPDTGGASLMLEDGGADDSSELSPRPDERVVQGIWHEQLLHTETLQTISGRSVRVIDPGRWNGEPGPDFLMAEIEIDGTLLRGDVEIHLASGDWERHQHSRDFLYNGVILHAFLDASDTARYDTAHNGTRIERIGLRPFLNPGLREIMASLGGDDYPTPETAVAGRCSPVLARLDPDFLERFFDSAGRTRMEHKIARLRAQTAADAPDQVLYQALMASMGYKGGKTLFYLLAKRTPLSELATYLRETPAGETVTAIESVLLHVGNLIPHADAPAPPGDLVGQCTGTQCHGTVHDAETIEYLNTMNRWWMELAGYYRDRLVPPTKRWHTGVRPANFPARRVSGIATVLALHDFRRGLVRAFAARARDAMAREPKTLSDFRREIKSLCLMLAPETTGYWTTRFTLGGRSQARRTLLIGADRAASSFFNAVLPMLFLEARQQNDTGLEKFLWRLHDHFPALGQNAVTKFMTHRLFGLHRPASIDFRREKYNQALFQVFHDCCGNNATTCDDCRFHRGELAMFPSRRIPEGKVS